MIVGQNHFNVNFGPLFSLANWSVALAFLKLNFDRIFNLTKYLILACLWVVGLPSFVLNNWETITINTNLHENFNTENKLKLSLPNHHFHFLSSFKFVLKFFCLFLFLISKSACNYVNFEEQLGTQLAPRSVVIAFKVVVCHNTTIYFEFHIIIILFYNLRAIGHNVDQNLEQSSTRSI